MKCQRNEATKDTLYEQTLFGYTTVCAQRRCLKIHGLGKTTVGPFYLGTPYDYGLGLRGCPDNWDPLYLFKLHEPKSLRYSHGLCGTRPWAPITLLYVLGVRLLVGVRLLGGYAYFFSPKMPWGDAY